jgi:hypothetical protein
MAQLKKIMEETELIFKEYDQLSYYDEDEPEVMLYIDDVLIGVIKVWLDGEEDNREYICINYEIVYLDNISKRNIK